MLVSNDQENQESKVLGYASPRTRYITSTGNLAIITASAISWLESAEGNSKC